MKARYPLFLFLLFSFFPTPLACRITEKQAEQIIQGRNAKGKRFRVSLWNRLIKAIVQHKAFKKACSEKGTPSRKACIKIVTKKMFDPATKNYVMKIIRQDSLHNFSFSDLRKGRYTSKDILELPATEKEAALAEGSKKLEEVLVQRAIRLLKGKGDQAIEPPSSAAAALVKGEEGLEEEKILEKATQVTSEEKEEGISPLLNYGWTGLLLLIIIFLTLLFFRYRRKKK